MYASGFFWLTAATCFASRLPQYPLSPFNSPRAPVGEVLTPAFPLLVWHGLGDNYKAEGLRSIGDLADAINPGTFTYFIRVDDDPSADRTATFLGNVSEQILKICDDIAAHPILSQVPAVNGLGFSQGGQFLRAYIERCNKPPVSTLVTFGSQHNGISEFQTCSQNDWLCQVWETFLKSKTWSTFAQSRLVPAQYYRDPEDIENYLENSNFLADINNERQQKNDTYRQNIKKLRRFAMYMFSEDVTVVPKETAHFSEVNTTSNEVTKLQDRKIYKEDWIGLRSLDEAKKLDFRVVEGGHMQLSKELLIETFKEYFGPGS